MAAPWKFLPCTDCCGSPCSCHGEAACCMEVVLSGVTSDSDCYYCDDINGTFTLAYVEDPGTVCAWEAPLFSVNQPYQICPTDCEDATQADGYAWLVLIYDDSTLTLSLYASDVPYSQEFDPTHALIWSKTYLSTPDFTALADEELTYDGHTESDNPHTCTGGTALVSSMAPETECSRSLDTPDDRPLCYSNVEENIAPDCVLTIAGIAKYDDFYCATCSNLNTDYHIGPLECVTIPASGLSSTWATTLGVVEPVCYSNMSFSGPCTYGRLSCALYKNGTHWYLHAWAYMTTSGEFTGPPGRIEWRLDMGTTQPTLDDIDGAVLPFYRQNAYGSPEGFATCNGASSTVTVTVL